MKERYVSDKKESLAVEHGIMVNCFYSALSNIKAQCPLCCQAIFNLRITLHAWLYVSFAINWSRHLSDGIQWSKKTYCASPSWRIKGPLDLLRSSLLACAGHWLISHFTIWTSVFVFIHGDELKRFNLGFLVKTFIYVLGHHFLSKFFWWWFITFPHKTISAVEMFCGEKLLK